MFDGNTRGRNRRYGHLVAPSLRSRGTLISRASASITRNYNPTLSVSRHSSQEAGHMMGTLEICPPCPASANQDDDDLYLDRDGFHGEVRSAATLRSSGLASSAIVSDADGKLLESPFDWRGVAPRCHPTDLFELYIAWYPRVSTVSANQISDATTEKQIKTQPIEAWPIRCQGINSWGGCRLCDPAAVDGMHQSELVSQARCTRPTPWN
jgi:hypothetical protein